MIANTPLPTDFSFKESHDSYSSNGTLIGHIVEQYINYWLTNSFSQFNRIYSEQDYLLQRYALFDKTQISFPLNQDISISKIDDSTHFISFDGLYSYADGRIAVPIEIKSGNLNGYLNHLKTQVIPFFNSYVHSVFITMKSDSYDRVIKRLYEIVNEHPKIGFIDISDITFKTKQFYNQINGLEKNIEPPFKTPDTKRTFICKDSELEPKPRQKQKKKKPWRR